MKTKAWLERIAVTGVVFMAATLTGGPASAAAVSDISLSGSATWRTAHGTPMPESGREVGLWATGAAATVTATSTAYASQVKVTGRGSACSGDASVSVEIDGDVVGSVTLPSGNEYRTFGVGPEIPSGTHTIKVTFVNDLNRPGECDRNAYLADIDLVTIKPDASTTGVPSGVDLIEVGIGDTVTATNGQKFTINARGELTITTSGLTISGYDIAGVVRIKANQVTVTNCRIRGTDLGTVGSGRKNTRLYSSEGTGNTISYSDVAPDAWYIDADGKTYVDTRWIGLGGGGFTADHVDLSGAVDLLQTTASNVTLTASYLHDNTQRAAGQDPWLIYAYPKYAADPSHADAWQIEGGSNLVVRGNTFANSPWTGFMVTQNVGKTDNVVIDGNWLGGGKCTINLNDNTGRGYERNVSITNNLFTGVSPTSAYPGCHVVSKFETRTLPHPGLVVSGNASTDGYDANRVSRG